MKEKIHPAYRRAHVVCACGAIIETRSTRGDFHIDICSACHPFFTGKQKLIDTAGRVERFQKKYGKSTSAAIEAASAATAARAAKVAGKGKKAPAAKPAT